MTGDTLLQAAAHEIAEVENSGIRYRIENLQPLFAARDHTGVGQCLQVTGNVCLGAAAGLDQRIHVLFARKQGVQEPQSHGLRKDGEAAGDQP